MSSTAEDPIQAISPKPPAPLYPDVPWWAVLVTAFVFATVGVIVGVFLLKDASLPSTPGGAGGAIIIDTISYIPHILLLFGVLADMFTLDGVWSIPSLIGVLSIFANYVFQYFWKGIDELVSTAKKTYDKGVSGAPVSASAPPSGAGRKNKGGALDPVVTPGLTAPSMKLFRDYNGCKVQGFGDFSTPYAPQTLVVTATVFSYYCFDLIANRGWVNSIAAILAFFVFFFGETAVIGMLNDKGCDGGLPIVGSSVRALFEGLMFGGIGYGVVQTYAPTRLPSSTISPFPRKSASDLSPGPDGKMYDADGYPYIILPNGQAVPDVSDASARAAFGQMAGGATGSTDTLASNCPGSPTACPRAR